MYKHTANSEQAQARTGNHATRGSAKGFADGGVNPASVLSGEDHLRNLQAAYGAVVKQLTERHYRTEGERASLVCQQQHLSQQIRDLREKLGTTKQQRAASLPQAFMNVCREEMPKLTFERIMQAALQRINEGKI